MKTVSGETLDACLDWWEQSERRRELRRVLKERDGIDPDDVIMSPDRARARGLTSTVCFPVGNLAPEGSVIKSTAIDPSLVGEDQVYRHVGRRGSLSRKKRRSRRSRSARLREGDVMVLICGGPDGRGDAGDLPDHRGAEGSCRTASMWRC